MTSELKKQLSAHFCDITPISKYTREKLAERLTAEAHRVLLDHRTQV